MSPAWRAQRETVRRCCDPKCCVAASPDAHVAQLDRTSANMDRQDDAAAVDVVVVTVVGVDVVILGFAPG